jgi:aspartate ammonia-lyase
METRIESDLIGSRNIDDGCYYGVQTLRAKENFDITGIQISETPSMIVGLAYVKKAAALANQELTLIPENVADAIQKACNEIISGKLHDQFIVDVFQGGAGTSTNMNANEVIANRALEIMGHKKGEYFYCHPNNHVNCSQSTNDVYPTAFRIALYLEIKKFTIDLRYLQNAFLEKGNDFADIIKMGRTQLQDAVPMTLGQEFHAYATTIGEDLERINELFDLIREINLGATAIGTGINSPPDYTRIVTKHLRDLTDINLVTSPNLIEATWDTGAYVQISGVLKRTAIKLSKICNDLRLLSSGPRAGLNEINLPKLQPGSSIMPGKVNPVIPEVVNQVAFQVIGADTTISMASEAGQLQLNVMEPVIAFNLFQSIKTLGKACSALATKCVAGISANKDCCKEMVENSIGIVTALAPSLGYEKTSLLAKEALATNSSVYDLVLKHNYLSKERLDEILSPQNMI